MEDFVPKKWPQIYSALAANIGAFSLGCANGWSSPALPDLEDSNDLGYLTIDQKSWIVSLASLACFFAVYPSAYIIQKIGRKPTMILLSIPFIAGWLILGFATNVEMIYIGRILTGLASGSSSVIAPVFIAEMSEASIRGALGSGFQLMVVTGILFTFVFGTFLSWKWLAFICIAPAIISFFMLLIVPESPRYLLSKGKQEDAAKALMWFRGATKFEQIEDEHNETLEAVEEAKKEVTKLKDLLQPIILKPTIVCIILLVCQQLCGIDAVTFYTVTIFKDAGSDIDENLSTIIFGIVQVIFNFIALFVVERAGRRMTLISTNLVLILSLISMGVFFFLKDKTDVDTSSIGWLPLVSLNAYAAAFSLGIGPIAWLEVGEILPNNVIGIVSPIATSSLWLLSFFITRFFEVVNEEVGNAYCFWFFAVCTIAGTIYIFFFVPETKNLTLEQVQDFFKK